MTRLNPVTMVIASVAILATSGSLLATQTSDRIETSAKTSYVFKTYLKDDNVTIKAINDSVVVLTGTVSEWPHRSLAEETVSGLPGVKRVDNKLEVNGGQPPENSDVWISMKVATTLMFHRNVSVLKTDVEVKNGTVTLHGKASSEAQKELTTEYVKDVDGVQSVKNNMTIENAKKTNGEKVSDFVDDASITAQVKIALLFHRSTNVIKTKVETKNGIVTVSGVAKNGAEKDLIVKLINDIKGVKSIKNEIIIGS